ncbi:hypothetical protein AAG906_032004 [Vitis piasezkii]
MSATQLHSPQKRRRFTLRPTPYHQPPSTQPLFDPHSGGLIWGDLRRLMGSDTLNHNLEIEDLYEKMILKLKELARLMDKSSARVLEQGLI